MIQILIFSFILNVVYCQYNPSILEDMRSEPRQDGSFGFLYHTEDGITHAAKAVPGGVVQGRFTYTDPTGLKVNFNYNAGSNFKAPNVPAPVTHQDNYPQNHQQNYPPTLQQQQQQQQPVYRPQKQNDNDDNNYINA